jgi:hypothetical protein
MTTTRSSFGNSDVLGRGQEHGLGDVSMVRPEDGASPVTGRSERPLEAAPVKRSCDAAREEGRRK